MEDNYQLVTKTAAGLEEVLAAEIKALGAKNVRILHRAVLCEGNKELMYRINYTVRTALKVLKPFKTFYAKTMTSCIRRFRKSIGANCSAPTRLSASMPSPADAFSPIRNMRA